MAATTAAPTTVAAAVTTTRMATAAAVPASATGPGKGQSAMEQSEEKPADHAREAREPLVKPLSIADHIHFPLRWFRLSRYPAWRLRLESGNHLS